MVTPPEKAMIRAHLRRWRRSAARSTYGKYASRAALGCRLAAGPFSSLSQTRWSEVRGERCEYCTLPRWRWPRSDRKELPDHGLPALVGLDRFPSDRYPRLTIPRRTRRTGGDHRIHRGDQLGGAAPDVHRARLLRPR